MKSISIKNEKKCQGKFDKMKNSLLTLSNDKPYDAHQLTFKKLPKSQKSFYK